MYRDPCRRFTLGAAVDGTRIRLWIYTRSMMIASEPFDFNIVSAHAYTIIRQLNDRPTETRDID